MLAPRRLFAIVLLVIWLRQQLALETKSRKITTQKPEDPRKRRSRADWRRLCGRLFVCGHSGPRKNIAWHPSFLSYWSWLPTRAGSSPTELGASSQHTQPASRSRNGQESLGKIASYLFRYTASSRASEFVVELIRMFGTTSRRTWARAYGNGVGRQDSGEQHTTTRIDKKREWRMSN